MKSILFPALVIGILTAFWFGITALRSGQSKLLLGLGGGLLGVVTSALCLGVRNATFLPLSDAERTRGYLVGIVLAFVVTAAVSFAFIKAVGKSARKGEP